MAQARLRHFKPLAEFEWNWPKKIDRPLIERALTLHFFPRGRNLILCGTAGLGKTMIAKNLAYAAVLAGHSALFRTASDLLADLDGDSLGLRRLETYRQTLLDLYLRLPDTPCRVSSHDVRLVRQLWERDIPLTTAETAPLLASV